MTTPPDSTNGRVTMALLGAKIDTLIRQGENRGEQLDLLEKVGFDHSVQLETMGGQIATQYQRLDGRINTECARLDGRIDATNDNVKGWQRIQAGLSLVLTAIAGFLGVKL